VNKSLIVLFLLVPGWCFSAPNVSGINTGGLNHGGPVVIYGYGFGYDADPTPLFYDDLSFWDSYGFSHMDEVPTGDMPEYVEASSGREKRYYNSTLNRAPGQPSYYFKGDKAYIQGSGVYFDYNIGDNDPFVVVSWIYPSMFQPDGLLDKFKIDKVIRVWANPSGAGDTAKLSHMGRRTLQNSVNYYHDENYEQNAWSHYEFAFRNNASGIRLDSSTAARFDYIKNGAPRYRRALLGGNPGDVMSTVVRWGQDATDWDHYTPESFLLQYGLYINDTLARVVISDNLYYVYDNGPVSHWEMQWPLSWADGQINATVDAGSFPDQSSVYLFVVDSSGSTSNAYGPLTINREPGDTEAPDPPSGFSGTTGNDGEAVLSWDANDEPDIAYYRVLRSGTSGGPYSYASGPIAHPTVEFTNTGLNHGVTYYFVCTAIDDSGNVSGWSSEDSVVPTGEDPITVITEPDSLKLSPFLELDLPIYGAIFTGIGDLSYDSAADSLDIAIFGHEYMLDADLIGFVDSVRTRNPDFIVLNYVWAFGARTSWDTGSGFYDDLFNIAVRNSDGWVEGVPGGNDGILDFWMYDTDGNHAMHAGSYPSRMWNPAAPGLADSLAAYYVARLKDQGNLADYTGFFVDWLFANDYPPWPFQGYTAERDSLDMNEDGQAYGMDGGVERALYEEFVNNFARACRRAANNDKFLVVPNGSAGYGSATRTAGDFDGLMIENFSTQFPTSRASLISLLVTVPDAAVKSRVNHPLILWYAEHDSVGMINEALGSIGDAIALYTSDTGGFAMPQRLLPTFGTRVLGSVTVSATGDTAFAKFYDGADTTYAWVVGAGSNQSFPLPYLITKGSDQASADTLSYGSAGIRAE